MNARKCIIIVCMVLLFALYLLGAYSTTQKFIQPEQKYYGLNELVECNGMSYKLVDMKMYSLEELVKKYNFIPEELHISTEFERHYYVATVEVTKLYNDSKISEIGKYNKYASSYASEVLIEDYINEKSFYSKDFEMGETIEYHFVKSFLDYEFTEETWNNLDESDMWLRMYDEENHYEIFLGTEL